MILVHTCSNVSSYRPVTTSNGGQGLVGSQLCGAGCWDTRSNSGTLYAVLSWKEHFLKATSCYSFTLVNTCRLVPLSNCTCKYYHMLSCIIEGAFLNRQCHKTSQTCRSVLTLKLCHILVALSHAKHTQIPAAVLILCQVQHAAHVGKGEAHTPIRLVWHQFKLKASNHSSGNQNTRALSLYSHTQTNSQIHACFLHAFGCQHLILILALQRIRSLMTSHRTHLYNFCLHTLGDHNAIFRESVWFSRHSQDQHLS